MIGEKIIRLIDSKLDEINTLALGKITQIDLSKLRCNVKLKHRIQGQEIELFDLPIAVPKFADSSITIAPAEGDICLVVFSKYELEEQLKNKDIVAVNEILQFNTNHAVVLTGIFTLVDQIPQINKDEILIWHKTGAYLKFKEDGSLEIKAKRVDFLQF
jgi:hypothetical protein